MLNKKVSKYQIFISGDKKRSIDYIRHNDIPGKWQIMLFFNDFLVLFENLENFKVYSPTREVLLSSPCFEDTVKQGLQPMLEILFNGSRNNYESLPLAIDCIDVFKILNALKL